MHTGLEITAVQQSLCMSRQNWDFSSQIFALLVILTCNAEPETGNDQAKTN